jgi:uncharacterized membrane protein YhiD involved in acid resistance
MPEWLHDSFRGDTDTSLSVLVLRLCTAFVLGCMVAGVYRLTHGRAGRQSVGLTATLVLLTLLIAMVTLVIGNRANSVALAFSLVGALAIVRFRTVVEDTRDTAFVIFAVAVGMAVGAGFLTIPLVGIPIAAVAAFLFRPPAVPTDPDPCNFTLTVRIGLGQSPDVLLHETFRKHVERSRLVATATARQGAALELTYRVRLYREGMALTLVTELHGLEGVQNVELRQA